MKKVYTNLLLTFLMILTTLVVNAQQTNLAISGTFSQSDNRAAPYGASNFNDQIISQGTFSWISGSTGTGSWFQVDWTSAQTFDSLTVYVDQTTTRTLVGATLQSWNGSSWVTHMTYSINPATDIITSGSNYYYNVSLPTPVTTSRFRFYNLSTAGSQASNPSIREVEIRQNIVYALDAAVKSIDAPITPVTPGNNDVYATIMNIGTTTLTSCMIGWSIDNVAQTPIQWSGSMAQYANSGSLKLGTYNFTFGNPQIKVWTYNPNNSTDDNTLNDEMTKTVTVCIPSSGTYTINSSGTGDFTTFNDALASITACGINGPVVFEVAPGTYNEQVTIPPILGANATNTITFRGVSRTNTVLTWGNPSGTTADRHTVILNGADYIRFENMTINSTHTSYATCVLFTGGADYNKILNCNLNVDSTGSANSYLIVINCSGSTSSYSTGDNSMENIVKGCVLKGGYWNVYWRGNSYSTRVHNQFIENIYTHAIYYGHYQYYCMGNVLKNNRIINMRQYPNSTYFYGYGIYASYGAADTIDGNQIQPGRYGIYLYRSNYYTPTTSSIVVNNMIHEFKDVNYYMTGIYCYYCDNTDIYSNTVWIANPKYTSYSYSYSALTCYYPYDVDIKNNIFISDGKALLMTLYVSSTTYHVECDYNLYYWNGGASDYRFYVYNQYFNDFNSFKNYTGLSNYVGTHDQNSLYNVDPGIIGRTDLHLQPGNQGIEGTLINLDHDFDNNRRCLLQSFLGADEPAWQVSKTDFLAEDTMCLNLPITFYNTGNESDPHRAAWYLNGTLSSNDFNFTTTINNSSLDTVSLEMETCSGVDSVGKLVRIMNPTTAPDIEFVVSNNVVETNELVYINDMSYQCPEEWEWEITPTTYKDDNDVDQPTFAYVNGTSDTSKNLEVVFYKDGALHRLPHR
jgi:parallel beta-helix repeat protein